MFLARRRAVVARSLRLLTGRNDFSAVTQCHLKRSFHSSSYIAAAAGTAEEEKGSVVPVEETSFALSERFIPVTRRSLMRFLLEEDMMNDDEKSRFEKFSAALDAAIENRYRGVLDDLKALFDPINPDKDTIQTREVNRKQCLDNEFWLIQKLSAVMTRANFYEIPKSLLEKALSEHQARDGVLVSVNPDRYDVLRFWALGQELPEQSWPWYQRLYYNLRKKTPPEPLQYYKRVVVASRLKRDQKLMLKMFKQIPVNALEQLLPDGKIRMTKTDKNIIKATVAVGTSGLLVKLLGYMVNQDLHWTLILSGACALVGVQSWTVYQNRKRNYLVELSRMLYFKNLSNNRGLLTLLVDRAQDESFKEALLVYTFLLCHRAPSTRGKESELQTPEELGDISPGYLEQMIEAFIEKKTNMRIDFDASEALTLLKLFGLVSEMDDDIHPLPMATAQRHLPQQPETIVVRPEADVSDIEGFDRDAYLESEKVLKKEDTKSRKYGWF